MKKNRELTEEEIKELEKGPTKKVHPYKKDGLLARIPFGVKALFIKWWFFGCGFFFIFMGLSNVIAGDTLVSGGQVLILGAILAVFNGVITDIAVDHFLNLMDTDEHKAEKYIFFHNSKFYSLVINLVYSFVVTAIVIYGTDLILYFLDETFSFTMDLEPVSVGLIYLAVDMLFISIKNLIVKTIRKKKGEKNV